MIQAPDPLDVPPDLGEDEQDDDEAEEAFADLDFGGAYEASCPYCGEPVTLFIDPGGGAEQEYVEDCSVCCRPWLVQVEIVDDEAFSVEITPSD